MSNKNKKLIGLAKSKGSKMDNTPIIEKIEKETSELELSPEDLRLSKAKKVIETLLDETSVVPKTNDKLLEVINNEIEDKELVNGNEWLKEQVALLSEENERLRNELATAKDNYTKIHEHYILGDSGQVFETETTTQNILNLFEELQNNLLGFNNERTPWSTVSIRHILNQMCILFPFTVSLKKF